MDPLLKKPTVVSLFTGAMGLDLGFENAGFEIKVCLEKDPWAVETIKANRQDLPVVPKDLGDTATADILDEAGLHVGEVTVVTGAPPCEPFSTAGHRMSILDSRATAIEHYIRIIEEARPQFFVFEEVPGFTRAAKKHISFYERVKKKEEDLQPDERLGSAFDELMSKLRATGYCLSESQQDPRRSILNAADYGTPQKRRRFILVGSREDLAVPLPQKTHGAPGSDDVVQGRLKPWLTFRDAVEGLQDPQPEYLKFAASWGKYLQRIPAGGNWRNLPEECWKDALGGAYDDEGTGLKGGRTGFLRRLAWEKPAPTVVDRPNTKASCLCHPSENRPLSVREYGRLQGFPDDWSFRGPLAARYQLIGQATPVQLATAIAKVVKDRIYACEHQSSAVDSSDSREQALSVAAT